MDESTIETGKTLEEVLIPTGEVGGGDSVLTEEAEEVEELSSKEKKKLINVENLTRKFKSQVQGNQKKISTWEDRTVAKLKQMGFRTAGFGDDGKWRLTMVQTPQGQILDNPITACISSNHGPRSSTGFLKFTDSTPVVPAEKKEE